jgi:hypothetical protein
VGEQKVKIKGEIRIIVPPRIIRPVISAKNRIDLIQPGTAGWDEMEVKSLPLLRL